MNEPFQTETIDLKIEDFSETERWRYIRYSSGEEELYDTRHDSHELVNRVREEPHPPQITSVLNILREQLDELLESN